MGRRLGPAAVGVLSITALLAACGGGEPPADQMPADTAVAPAPTTPPATPPAGAAALPPGVTQEMVAAGQQTFSTVCVACHGPDATGTPLAPNLTDNVWLNISGRNYDEIVNLVKTGVDPAREAPAPMPPMGGAQLTDQQVNEVAAYVMTLGG